MNKTTVPMSSMGVLNLHRSDDHFTLTRHTPSGDTGYFVKHYWIVSWDLTGQPPRVQDVVPNPCVNLVVEPERSAFFAPSNRKFSYHLQGKGCVFGVKFKPGAFYPFIKRPVSELSGRPLDVRSVLGIDACSLERAMFAQRNEADMVQLAESLIRPKLPEQDDTIPFINRIVDRIMHDREITRVDQICERFGINIRKLQRIFRGYVGVSPKWVIKLYRLQNAAEEMEHGRFRDMAQLSTELGYHDQSHFIKDFKAAVGKTPEEYAKSSYHESGET
ncbi:helix-turn-helix domain-containing protein [Paenibacillus thermotolerans]|uniref:helix-turn-helix domain-containing protein n=1 Tax=Paenibacillus thermotolerans TaxID=3027807 RepID=UPI0023687934|nr:MULTISPECIES: helix-turn-helix domain-containing protein [unclassified Paenibacillus]